MNYILVGNVLSLAGAIVMTAIGLIADKKKFLLGQCVQLTLMGIGNAVLGGFTGLINDAVAILRNVCAYRFTLNVWVKLGFIVLQTALSLAVGPLTPIGVLPLLSGALFTWCIDLRDPVKFKVMVILCQITWIVYDMNYLNYTAALFDACTVVSNALAIVRIKKAGLPR